MLLNNDDWALRDKHIDTCLSEQVGYALNFAGSANRGEVRQDLAQRLFFADQGMFHSGAY